MMKTKSLFFAALVTVTATVSAFGNDKPEMTVVAIKGSEIFKVIYKGETQGKVKVNIFDANGRVIHTAAITGRDGFIYPLNFKDLESGDYTIELIDDAGKYQKVVTFQPEYQQKAIHVSRIQSEENKFLLAVANAGTEAIRVTIYDARHNVLFDETRSVTGDFAQVYKVKNPDKRLSFEVSDASGHRKYFSF